MSTCKYPTFFMLDARITERSRRVPLQKPNTAYAVHNVLIALRVPSRPPKACTTRDDSVNALDAVAEIHQPSTRVRVTRLTR